MNKCPHCGTELNDESCPECGYSSSHSAKPQHADKTKRKRGTDGEIQK